MRACVVAETVSRHQDARQANTRAKPVLMEFDQIIARAEASPKPLPFKASLSDHEIKRIAAYHFASMLSEDEEHALARGAVSVVADIMDERTTPRISVINHP